MNVLFKQYTNNFYGSISTPITSTTSLTQLWFNCGLLTAHCCGVCAGAYLSLQLHFTIINYFPFRYIFMQSLSIRSCLIRNIEFVCPSIHRQFLCVFFSWTQNNKINCYSFKLSWSAFKSGAAAKEKTTKPSTKQ